MTTHPAANDSRPRRRSILTPVAYSEALMPSLQLARSSRIARRIAVIMLLLLLQTATIFLMAVAPWQQTMTGAGYVVAYAPRERQQVLEATTEGRIFRWNEELFENARVSKGDFIAEIGDIDDSDRFRLRGQMENTIAILDASQKMVTASEGQLATDKRVATEIEAAQNAYVQSATEKVTAAEQKLAIAEAAIFQLQAAYNRAKDLQAAGNIALEKLQEIERKLQESQATQEITVPFDGYLVHLSANVGSQMVKNVIRSAP